MSSLPPVAIRLGIACQEFPSHLRSDRYLRSRFDSSSIVNDLNDPFIESLESDDDVRRFPVRFEPLESFEEIREHLRRRETHSAVVELLISISWLNQAARVAKIDARISLEKAVEELQIVADEVALGKPILLSKIDILLALASNAFAKWHFDRADYFWGKEQSAGTGNNIVMAATFLRYSSTLLKVALSKDTVDTVFKTFRFDTLFSIENHTNRYWTARDFEVIKMAIYGIDVNTRSKYATATQLSPADLKSDLQ